jgi:hypothetical protein
MARRGSRVDGAAAAKGTFSNPGDALERERGLIERCGWNTRMLFEWRETP